MARVLKLDDFSRDFPSKWGLEANGSCYEVNEPFEIDVIIGYDDAQEGKTHYKKPKWNVYNTQDGDTLVCSQNGVFLVPKDKDLFVECCPKDIQKNKGIGFGTFPMDKLTKIGIGAVRAIPMPFEQREKLVTSYSV